MQLRTTARSTVIGFALLTVAACGGGGGGEKSGEVTPGKAATPKSAKEESPQELADIVQVMFRSKESLRVAGTMHTGSDRLTVDLTVGGEGRCVGKVSVTGVGAVEMVGSGENLWVRPDLAYAQALVARVPPAEAERFTARLDGTRYLQLPKAHPLFKDLAAYCDRAGVKNQLEEGFLPGRDLKAGPAGSVDGQETVSYVYTYDDEDGETVTTTVDVSVEHLVPLRASDRSAKSSSSLTFSGYDAPVQAAAPTADLIVPIAEVQKTLDLATPGA